MSKITVGLVGAGLLGLTHSFCLKILKDTGLIDLDLVSVYDTEKEKAESLVQNMGFSKIVKNPLDIFDDKKINTVFIATPTVYHKEYVIAAAHAKKNIFCEKPLYINLEGSREMTNAVTKAKVRNGVGLVLRYSPTFTFFRGLISQKNTGYPILASMRDDQVLPIRGLHHSQWRADVAKSGGGTIIEHSIHDLDLFRYLFGKPKIVDSELKYLSGKEGIEDYARVVMKFPSGMEGILTSLWHDMVTRTSNRHFEVLYQKLFIATDHDFLGPVEYTCEDGECVLVTREEVLDYFLKTNGLDTNHRTFFAGLDYNLIGSYVMEDYFFLKSIIDGKTFTPNFEDAVLAHEIVDEIYKKQNAI